MLSFLSISKEVVFHFFPKSSLMDKHNLKMFSYTINFQNMLKISVQAKSLNSSIVLLKNYLKPRISCVE